MYGRTLYLDILIHKKSVTQHGLTPNRSEIWVIMVGGVGGWVGG